MTQTANILAMCCDAPLRKTPLCEPLYSIRKAYILDEYNNALIAICDLTLPPINTDTITYFYKLKKILSDTDFTLFMKAYLLKKHLVDIDSNRPINYNNGIKYTNV
jgi:hypothetical protein